MKRQFIIDCFPESAQRYKQGYAIVIVDVLRASTTIVSALGKGFRIYPVQTTDEAFILASALKNPFLVGELGGNVPFGFDMTNSPVEIMNSNDTQRPIIFISSSGSQLMRNSIGADAIYISSFRNFSAVANYAGALHDRIAIIGAGTRGQFRREDLMGCAWLAEMLLKKGFDSGNPLTSGYLLRWKGHAPEAIRDGRSAEYLIKTKQVKDLEFTIEHIDDLEIVPSLVDGEIIDVSNREPISASSESEKDLEQRP